MKKYVDNFMQYRFLLSELVKKGIKLKYRRSYLGIVSCIYPDRTTPVQFLFTVHQGRFEIYTSELGNDQKGICTQIFVSAVQCAF